MTSRVVASTSSRAWSADWARAHAATAAHARARASAWNLSREFARATTTVEATRAQIDRGERWDIVRRARATLARDGATKGKRSGDARVGIPSLSNEASKRKAEVRGTVGEGKGERHGRERKCRA